MFHRLEPRIRAHVLLCWLALLLIRVAERRTEQTWPTLARELGRVHAVTLTGPTGTVTQTTELTHRPAGHCSRLRRHPAAPHHRPTPRLTCTDTVHGANGACSDTPSTPVKAHLRRSTPRFGGPVNLRTAEPGS